MHEANDDPSRVRDAQSGVAYDVSANASNPEDLQHSVKTHCLEENGIHEQKQLLPTQGNGNSNDDEDNEHDAVAVGSGSKPHRHGLPGTMKAQAIAPASLDHMPQM